MRVRWRSACVLKIYRNKCRPPKKTRNKRQQETAVAQASAIPLASPCPKINSWNTSFSCFFSIHMVAYFKICNWLLVPTPLLPLWLQIWQAWDCIDLTTGFDAKSNRNLYFYFYRPIRVTFRHQFLINLMILNPVLLSPIHHLFFWIRFHLSSLCIVFGPRLVFPNLVSWTYTI